MTKDNEVTRARIQARFKEFPFLESWSAYLVGVPLIQRMDLDLLDAQSWTSAWSQHVGRDKVSRMHQFICENGQTIGSARQNAIQTRQVPHKFLGFRLSDNRIRTPVMGETVLTALRLLDDPDLVTFVLRVCLKDDGTRWLTLFKVPKGKTLSEWIRRIKESALDELRHDLSIIDNV